MSERHSDANRQPSRRRRIPVMEQVWQDLLFLHWPLPAPALRAVVPRDLEIEEFDGTAWIGITPLTIRGMRPPYVPPVPLLSGTLEINVRTYVRYAGISGIWFLSLEASNRLAVLGARVGFGLPYFPANMAKLAIGETIAMESRRTAGPQRAELAVEWTRGKALPLAEPGTLEFFLIERFCLYTYLRKRLKRVRIRHRPWPLCEATVDVLDESLIESHGLRVSGRPLVHAQREAFQVEAELPESPEKLLDAEIGSASALRSHS
ncbi:MAG TPA: DUF2071 domain-containing protein [Pirellulaceae bacterium]|jgi:hypothetical protein|nr:DUF2071 domain-containing protein [Pirellulaceae bacterium]